MGTAEINDQLMLSLTLTAPEAYASVVVPRACILYAGVSHSTGPSCVLSVYRVRPGFADEPINDAGDFIFEAPGNASTQMRMNSIYPANRALAAGDSIKVTKDVGSSGTVYFYVVAPGANILAP